MLSELTEERIAVLDTRARDTRWRGIDPVSMYITAQDALYLAARRAHFNSAWQTVIDTVAEAYDQGFAGRHFAALETTAYAALHGTEDAWDTATAMCAGGSAPIRDLWLSACVFGFNCTTKVLWTAWNIAEEMRGDGEITDEQRCMAAYRCVNFAAVVGKASEFHTAWNLANEILHQSDALAVLREHLSERLVLERMTFNAAQMR